MKRKLLLLVTLAVVALLAFAACTGGDDTPAGTDTNQQAQQPAQDTTPAEGSSDATTPATDDTTTPATDGDKIVINVHSFTDELVRMAARYAEINPSFGERFTINSVVVGTDDGAYQTHIDASLREGQVDLYTAESGFVIKYTQGDMAEFAMPYEDLGIENLRGKLASAEIAPYIVDIGTRDGDVVGLAFQHTGSALIYRRSLAQQVWGTDDPAVIAEKTGGGQGWDKFLEAAAELDAAGISITSGIGDVWQAVRNTGGPWIVNNRINIHPDREAMFDIAKVLYQNNFTNDAAAWGPAWNADMKGEGVRPVFAYLGPAWLVNHVMIHAVGNPFDDEEDPGTFGDWAMAVPPVGFSWGGTWVLAANNMNPAAMEGVRELIEWIALDSTNTGLQSFWASGTLFEGSGTKDAVASGVVMAGADGSIPMLGGQDMFKVLIPAGEYADGSLFTQYDEQINEWFFDDAVMHYARGDMTREEAIEAFMLLVNEGLGLE